MPYPVSHRGVARLDVCKEVRGVDVSSVLGPPWAKVGDVQVHISLSGNIQNNL